VVRAPPGTAGLFQHVLPEGAGAADAALVRCIVDI